MKTKGRTSLSALRIGAVAAVAMALVATTVTSVQAADTPKFGAVCTAEGVSTGTSTTSLICAKNASGKLAWAKVRLGQSTGKPVAALKAAPGSIEYHHYSPEQKDLYQKIINQFQDENPGVKVTQVIMNSVDFTNLAYARISVNPKAAVMNLFRGGQFNQFYNGGVLADLSSQRFIKQNVVSSALAPATVNGKVYGLPYLSLFNNPIYNSEMFAKNGWKVPTNWTQTLAFCKTVKAAGIIPFAWPAATLSNAGQILNSFLMNSAPNLATLEKRILDIDTGKADLTSDWFKEMATKYKQMNDAGCFPANVTGYTDVIAPADFAFGKAAVYPTGTFGMATVKALNPAMTGKMKIMGLITTDDKPLLYEGITNNTAILAVNKKSSSRDQAIARAFISYLATPAIAQQFALGSSQHVSIINVNYSANVDLLNTSDIMGKKLLLAPRFLFNNVGQVRNPMESALIAIAGGADITKTLADTSKTIKQGLGA